MIGALKGNIADRNGDRVLIDVQGVGYEVTVTSAALAALSPDGSNARLVIFTDVKENSISLFGFKNSLEKEVFLLLKKVKGVGSKIALSVVSAIGAEGVLSSIGQNDVSRLKRVPGIGGKTAERIIVELRENVQEFVVESESPLVIEKISEPAGSSMGRVQLDVVLALEKLGFPSDRAKQVVASAVAARRQGGLADFADSADLLRLALSGLAPA
ncbi:MAG: Holliday junction branch migration protein RuvA [Bdellovibrionota bacterium]